MKKSVSHSIDAALLPEQLLLVGCMTAAILEVKSPHAFFAWFSPREIMRALDQAPQLQADILLKVSNIDPDIGAKLTPLAASEIWSKALALETAGRRHQASLQVFTPQHQVRYLAAIDLWSFFTSSRWWLNPFGTPGPNAEAVAAMVLTLVLKHRLLTQTNVLKTLGRGAKTTEMKVFDAYNAMPASKRRDDREALGPAEHVPSRILARALCKAFSPFIIYTKIIEPLAIKFGWATPEETTPTTLKGGMKRSSRRPPAP